MTTTPPEDEGDREPGWELYRALKRLKWPCKTEPEEETDGVS